MNSFVQLKSISLSNFKNVALGTIDIKNNILGVYGQNGSGKTALVDALDMFQKAARGEQLPKFSENLIMSGKDFAECTFAFDKISNDGKIESSLEYTFRIQRTQQECAEIVSERISEKKIGEMKKILVNVDKSSRNKWISPMRDWKFAFESKDSSVKFEVVKEITSREQRSMLFSKNFEDFAKASPKSPIATLSAIEKIRFFAQVNLFVIKSCGRSPFNIDFAFPFNFQHLENKNLSFGTIQISLQGPNVVPQNIYEIIEKSFREMNLVLQEVIPGLNVVVKNEGSQQTSNGLEGIRFELLSRKSEQKGIPLRYESDGVKKIISILSILISVYNNPETFLAVDELDAGIYEYLLGEILEILDEKAKGRLLFTSHNLRPLEMIKKDSLMFTTTNEFNRYIRLSRIQANNNPRNVYLRSIGLGGQKEKLYQETNNFKIDRAFRNAWRMGNDEN